MCSIRWMDGSARIEPLGTGGATDQEILAGIEGADRVGIDIPLGWPSTFVEALSEHHQRHRWNAPADAEGMRALREQTHSWLTADAADWHAIDASDHVLDALVASLVARAEHCGLCVESEDATSDNARLEGWIALPLDDALPRLAAGI